ncbi:hypothetical protein [Nitrospina watsonii]|uniref:Uncharacterized protein n=1 Tax=Nitrospina watsonii TaxID=1323948 RepID=A0ABM9HH86_9BACT|nr:hypothetical protein [Nitrospina watsonii]CAI2719709.1 conserved protein of unknown function [Nitrospina watsonii]
MFYPVKVLDEDGKVKKVVSPKKLSKEYWGKIFDDTKNRASKRKGKRSVAKTDVLTESDEYALED